MAAASGPRRGPITERPFICSFRARRDWAVTRSAGIFRNHVRQRRRRGLMREWSYYPARPARLIRDATCGLPEGFLAARPTGIVRYPARPAPDPIEPGGRGGL